MRWTRTSNIVDGQLVSSIGPGLLALVGMCNEDTVEQAEALVRKLLALRLWPEQAKVVDGSVSAPAGETRAWRASVTDIGGEVLCGLFRVGCLRSFSIHSVCTHSQGHTA